ncbi:ORF8 [Chimpanzee stool associated circular ssDNA virus]|nr:ORF8 [Chimpanzee stool associated circular ssDNA virus]
MMSLAEKHGSSRAVYTNRVCPALALKPFLNPLPPKGGKRGDLNSYEKRSPPLPRLSKHHEVVHWVVKNPTIFGEFVKLGLGVCQHDHLDAVYVYRACSVSRVHD